MERPLLCPNPVTNCEKEKRREKDHEEEPGRLLRRRRSRTSTSSPPRAGRSEAGSRTASVIEKASSPKIELEQGNDLRTVHARSTDEDRPPQDKAVPGVRPPQGPRPPKRPQGGLGAEDGLRRTSPGPRDRGKAALPGCSGRTKAEAGSRPKQEERRNDMKKTTKKSPSKASHKKAVKNLDVKPAKGGTVRGGRDDEIPKESAEEIEDRKKLTFQTGGFQPQYRRGRRPKGRMVRSPRAPTLPPRAALQEVPAERRRSRVTTEQEERRNDMKKTTKKAPRRRRRRSRTSTSSPPRAESAEASSAQGNRSTLEPANDGYGSRRNRKNGGTT